MGAAIQGGVLGGEVKDILAARRYAASRLGVRNLLGGVMTVLIPHATPRSRTRKSETSFRPRPITSPSVEIHVLQGERKMARRQPHARSKFHLMGNASGAARGLPQVEVTFDIDANGILERVSAKDLATKKEQKITITASTGLSKEEAEKMRNEADSHAEDDRQKLAEVEVRNTLDNRVYQVEKLIRENREKLADGDVKPIEEAIEKGKSARGKGRHRRWIRQSRRPLRSSTPSSHKDCGGAVSPVGATTAGTPGGSEGPGPAGDGAGAGRPAGQKHGEGEVIDAEYVDVDESKKPN